MNQTGFNVVIDNISEEVLIKDKTRKIKCKYKSYCKRFNICSF